MDKKPYNPESFRAQMSSIWKTRKRFEIQEAGMGYGLKDCLVLSPAGKNKIRDNPPYSMALKAESNLVGKESMKLNAFSKKRGS
ncbi:hypothetical protein PVK06_044645 [Gossypium arboreum]|uniref:Uncharacterized protein n=1 Tax=Gossypium arboreum TaxID=29729 RepID=A0ABR0MRS0_GOSAR|nr:hypothetical protein PVK06_044645 [Gossypium arboreum]